MSKKVSTNKKSNPGLLFLYKTIVGRMILKIIVMPIWSLVTGKVLDTKWSTIFISSFVKKHQIDLALYTKQEFESFNDFFTRELIKEQISIDPLPEHMISPCDGKLSVYKINQQGTFKIKNAYYNVTSLINNQKLAKEYENGYCLVFRLCVDDYHRYIYIDNGKQEASVTIKGKLHTVQPIALDYYPVYITNHRVYTVVKTENFDQIIQIEVGALMVGKIKNLYPKAKKVKRGETKGQFEFGASSIVILIKPDVVNLKKEYLTNTNYNYETVVKIGEVIGTKKAE